LKRTVFSYLGLFSIVGIIIALDQWTKWLVRTYLPYTGTWVPQGMEWLLPYARIVHWNNSGAAFGLFQNGSLVFGILAVIVILVIIYFYPQTDPKDWPLRVAMGMQMAGAGGNLIDRIIFDGKVTDFISVGNFPVWNVADSSIVVGVAVLVVGAWWRERAEKASKLLLSVSSNQSSVSGDQPPVDSEQSSVGRDQSGESDLKVS
jgi:signal peptidase II